MSRMMTVSFLSELTFRRVSRVWGPLQLSADNFDNLPVSLRRCSPGIDRDYPLRLPGGECRITLVHTRKESAILLLEAVFIGGRDAALFAGRILAWIRGQLIAFAGSVQTHRRIGVEKNGQIRLQVSAKNAVQLEDVFAAQLAAIALVGLGGIGEAVAKNNFSAIQGRLDDLRNMLRAGGEHQGHFRQRREAGGFGVEQNLADFFRDRGSAGLARLNDFIARFAQNRRQLPELGALASPVETFEGDEFSRPQHRGMIAALVRRCTAPRIGCYSRGFRK